MFSILKKTPEINVDCFTTDSIIFNDTPIVKAVYSVPEWWKKLSRNTPEFSFGNFSKNVNMKDCYGFLQLFKHGMVLENWSDLHLSINKDNYYYHVSHGKKPSFHSKEQYKGGFENYHHLKMISPWMFSEKTGVKFLFTGCVWSHENYNFKVLPGIIDYKKNRCSDINIMLPAENKEYIIPVGFPMAHIIPLSEKELKIKNHLVSEQEFSKYRYAPFSSFFGWRKSYQLFDRNEKREKSKCPFSE